jgi:hypothetical protein
VREAKGLRGDLAERGITTVITGGASCGGAWGAARGGVDEEGLFFCEGTRGREA